MRIRQFHNEDFEVVLEITLLAFAPIHESFHSILSDAIFNMVYPDWRESYRQYFTSLAESNSTENIIVAEEHDTVIGYTVYSLNQEKEMGELVLERVMHFRAAVQLEPA